MAGKVPHSRGKFRKQRLASELPVVTNVSPPARSGRARIVAEALLRWLIELEVAKAQRLHYCISVVCLAVDSVTAPAGAMSRLAERFVDHLRSTDIVVPHQGGSSLTLLLVDARPDTLSQIIQRITEQLGPIPWSAGGATYPGTASDADDLLSHAADSLARAQEEGGQHLHIRSA